MFLSIVLEAQRERGLSRAALARAAGLDKSLLTRVLKGISPPCLRVVVGLGQVLGGENESERLAWIGRVAVLADEARQARVRARRGQ
jgi:transcriptional regulator with XRE-family HTH domain